MNKIAVFTDRDSKLCDFFEAERFLIFERTPTGWTQTSEANFEKITPSNPALTRKNTSELLPLIEGCNVLAGGALFGIPFAVFDRAKLHIFEIGKIDTELFDGIIEDLRNASAEASAKEAIIRDTKPVETSTPGVYFLDLIALQKECPEISSKKAMMDFLSNTPFLELRLICKHIPPWIENAGAYNVQTVSSDIDGVQALITRRC
ncbi:MAG: hypothetical protein LBI28_05430 [Treponema sp.]|jgi:hypothetical protein|nr:hypothetical protein [Treponema sp.]